MSGPLPTKDLGRPEIVAGNGTSWRALVDSRDRPGRLHCLLHGHQPALTQGGRGTLPSVRRYVITGAPGTGKTALVESLAHVGAVVGEAARELIAEHREATGQSSLDDCPGLFVERLILRSIEKFDAAPDGEATIYDRGLPDCVAYAHVFGVDSGPAMAAASVRRYSDPVFVVPPWEAIYSVDEMRRATFDQMTVFHNELVAAYETLGYQLLELPKVTVAERVQIVARFLQPTGL
jgi:predicted ATPase